MKKFYCVMKFLPIIVLFWTAASFAQSDVTSETKINVPGNKKTISENKSKIPLNLLEQYRQAKLSMNEVEKKRIGLEMEKYIEPSVFPPEGSSEPGVSINDEQAPYSPDWYLSDVLVHSGDISFATSYRQFDLKQGRDGWLYLAVNRRNVSGFTGAISVYKSGDGGATWQLIRTFAQNSVYFGTISMLVEKTSMASDDSVRIFVFFNRSSSSNLDNASLQFFSFRRNNTGYYSGTVSTPPAGNKLIDVTACSDGAYFTVGTYIHVLAIYVTNAGNSNHYIMHWATQNWGLTSFSSAAIFTASAEYINISAAFSYEGSLYDKIFIAAERRILFDRSDIGILSTPEIPTNSYDLNNITGAPLHVQYEKPCITIQQRSHSLPRRMLVTYTRNNVGKYSVSTNTGVTWGTDYTLSGTNGLVNYTWCSSDSLTAGTGYAIACYIDQNGDSVTVRRGNMEGSLGTYYYKRNSNPSTGLTAPVCAIYKIGSSKYSALAYAGLGPTNIYFNQEGLLTGIKSSNNEIPFKFELMQNYPNPFNPETNISFIIPKASFVIITIYDILGRNVQTLMSEELNAGVHSINWNASNFPSGVYFYNIQAGNFTETKKMILIK